MSKDNFNGLLYSKGAVPTTPSKLYTPSKADRRIPEIGYKSPTLGFASKSIPIPILDTDRIGRDTIVDQDHARKQQSLRTAIKTSFEAQDGIPVERKMEAAQLALQIGTKAESVGRVFQKSAYPEKDTDIARVIDRNMLTDEVHANYMNHLGEDETDTWDEKLNRPESGYTDLISEALRGLSTDGLKDIASFLPEGSATRKLVDYFTTAKDPSAITPFEDADVLQTQLGNRLKEAVLPKFGMTKDASLSDVLEFVSFLPANAEAEIDVENAVKIVFSQDTLDGRIQRLQQWDNEFRAKYGEEGYLQMAAFMVKEGAIDAAALALALKNPRVAGKLIADSKDKLLARFTKALGRASIMGTAGTGAQASIDAYLGFETDIPAELGLRVGGAFVGEGVAKAIASTGRGIVGAASRLIDEGKQLFGIQGHQIASTGQQAVFEAVSTMAPKNVGDQILADAMERLGLNELKVSSLATSITETANSSNTEPYRRLALEAIESFRVSQPGKLGHIFDLSESEMQAAAFGDTMKQEIMLHGVGNRLIGETVAKQTEVDNILSYYFDHGLRTVAKRPGKLQGDTSAFRWKEYASDPRNFVGDIADDLYDQLLNKDVYTDALFTAQEAAFKGLQSPAKQKVLSVRSKLEQESAKNPDMLVTTATLDRMGLSADEQDAYFAVGKLLDFSAILAETQMLSRAQSMGLKQLADGTIVQVKGVGTASGMIKVKGLKAGDPEMEIANSELADVRRIMGYKKNFVPRRAKDPDYLIGILNPTTGEIDIPFASRYRSEVDQKLLDLDNKLAGSGKVAFFWRNMTDEKSLNFGLSNNSTSIIDNLDEAGIARLREALSSTGRKDLADLDMENLRLAFDTITHGSVASQTIAGARGAKGLRTVTGDPFEYKPEAEAIAQHLMEVSALQFQDFRNNAITQFEKEFAAVLDPSKNWDQEIPNILGNSDLVQRAKSVQGFIKRNIFNDTSYGKEIRASIDAWADRMRKSGSKQKAMVDSLERMPIIEGLFKQTRDGTALFRASTSALVFAGNLGSFITQVAPSVAMIAGIKGITNPTHLIKGWGDMFGALAIKAGLPETSAPKAARDALAAIRKSGLLSKAELTDLSNAAYGQSSEIFNKAMFFVQKGEMANRANVWFTIRAEMMDKVNKGELMNLANTRLITKEEIDSTEFLQIVSEKAKLIHLDTTQAGRLKALTGAGSLIGQFTAPIIKTHTMWFAKDLSKAEKLGATLGLFSFYGINAIPFVAAGLYGLNKTGEWVTGGKELDDYTIATDITDNVANMLLDRVDDLVGFTEEQKDFFRMAVKKGGVAALSGGELDLYNRMSIGLFIVETSDHVEDPLDSIPFLSIMSKAAGSATNIGSMLMDLYESQINPDSEDQRIKDLQTFSGEIMDELGNAMPGFGRIVDVMNNHPATRKYLKPELADKDPNTGWVMRSGKRLDTGLEPTNRERLLSIFGIAPKPVQENREIMKGQFNHVDILAKMKAGWVDRYATAGTDTARMKVRVQALKEAAEAEDILLATYEGALSIHIKKSTSMPYKRGSLRRNWDFAFRRIDLNRISGNETRSKGEE